MDKLLALRYYYQAYRRHATQEQPETHARMTARWASAGFLPLILRECPGLQAGASSGGLGDQL